MKLSIPDVVIRVILFELSLAWLCVKLESVGCKRDGLSLLKNLLTCSLVALLLSITSQKSVCHLAGSECVYTLCRAVGARTTGPTYDYTLRFPNHNLLTKSQ